MPLSQTLNYELLTLCTSVDVLDVICGLLAIIGHMF
jgi:hypothetical protein